MQEKPMFSRLLEGLMDSRKFYLCIIDMQGYFVYANQALRKRFFKDTNTQKLPLYTDSIIPDDWEKSLKAAEECIKNPGLPVPVFLRKPTRIEGEVLTTYWEFIYSDKENVVLALGYEVTDKLRIRKELTKTLLRLQTILESVSDGYFVLDTKDQVISKNKPATDILNQAFGTHKKLSGKQIFAAISEQAKNTYKNAIHKGQTQRFEGRFPTSQDIYRFHLYPSSEGLAVVFRNINDEIEIRERLRISETRLRYFLNSTSDINILVDKNHQILLINKIAAEIINVYFKVYPQVGEDFRNYLVPGEGTAIYHKAFEDAKNGNSTSLEFEVVMNGRGHWFYYRYFPVYDEEGFLYGVALNVVDINEKKRSEQKLVESEGILRAIYNSTVESVVLLNKEGEIIYFNRSCHDLLQKEAKRVPEKGVNFLTYMAPNLQKEHEKIFRSALEGKRSDIELENKNKWYAFRYFPVIDDSGATIGVIQSILDITNQKKASQEIASQRGKLKTIAWQQSHLVRGPLSNIIGLVDMLEENPSNTELLLKYLKESAAKLDETIRSIVSETNEGKIEEG
jgi:PAS domain S-box-containing protein